MIRHLFYRVKSTFEKEKVGKRKNHQKKQKNEENESSKRSKRKYIWIEGGVVIAERTWAFGEILKKGDGEGERGEKDMIKEETRGLIKSKPIKKKK